MSDPEGDIFEVTFNGLQSFMTAVFDKTSGQILFKIDESRAVDGNYTLSYEATSTVNGKVLKSTFSTLIEVKNYT